jgi:hypothetical protein
LHRQVAITINAAKLEENQLPYPGTFSKAAESSSFTAAAKALGLTQAAVSQRIHSLAKALGKSLFRGDAPKVANVARTQKGIVNQGDRGNAGSSNRTISHSLKNSTSCANRS